MMLRKWQHRVVNAVLINVPVADRHLRVDVLSRVDNVLQRDSPHMNLSDLGIEPVSMDKTAFDFLHRFRKGGHFVLAKGYH